MLLERAVVLHRLPAPTISDKVLRRSVVLSLPQWGFSGVCEIKTVGGGDTYETDQGESWTQHATFASIANSDDTGIGVPRPLVANCRLKMPPIYYVLYLLSLQEAVVFALYMFRGKCLSRTHRDPHPDGWRYRYARRAWWCLWGPVLSWSCCRPYVGLSYSTRTLGQFSSNRGRKHYSEAEHLTQVWLSSQMAPLISQHWDECLCTSSRKMKNIQSVSYCL